MKELILIGGGGHCSSVIDLVEQGNEYTIKGILDSNLSKSNELMGYPLLGRDDQLESLVSKGFFFAITIGQIKAKSESRLDLFHRLKTLGAKLPILISPRSYVSKYAVIGEGSVVHHGVVINANASIGVNCIINTGSIIEHDVKIGSHSHISTNVVINGNSSVNSHCFIGSSACIIQGIHFPSESLLGAGSTLTENVCESGVYVGSPARKLK